jgi:cytochrome o ubiquinol oxidase subunit II
MLKPYHNSRQRRGLAVVTGIILPFLLLATTNAQPAELIILDPAGPIANSERELIALTLGLMLLVVLPVFAMTAWFAWHYRATNANARYDPQWSSTKVDVLLWLAPTLIVLLLAVVTWRYTHQLDPEKPIAASMQPLNVQVIALDWKWLFIYPELKIATLNQLVIPAGRPVSFDITSDSVMTSLFIPQLGGQIYAMAGMRTRLNLLADKPGTFRGENTQYSGRGFPDQHFQVMAKTADDFKHWVAMIQQQTSNLDWQHFTALAKPSVSDKARGFGNVEPGLFDHVLEQYNQPPSGDSRGNAS